LTEDYAVDEKGAVQATGTRGGNRIANAEETYAGGGVFLTSSNRRKGEKKSSD